MFNFIKKPIDAAKDKVNEYVNIRLEEAKLTTIEKASPIAASIVIGFIIVFVFFLIMLFLGLSLAEYFGVLFDSITLGYLCTAGIYILLFVFFLLCFKWISKGLTNKIAKVLYDAFH